MRKKLITMLMAVGFALATAAPAGAIVHPVTPISCNGAVEASAGHAGGVAAFDVLSDPDNPAPGPPMPAQGLAHSSACQD